MLTHRGRLIVLWLLLGAAASVEAEVLVRWDQDQLPSRDSLGISTVVIPAKNAAAVRNAIAAGYRVYVEVEASALSGFALPAERLAGAIVRGEASPDQLSQLGKRLTAPDARVLSLDERAKWPHIRANRVTRRNEVLQVSSRTSQPWLEQNAALVRVAQAKGSGSVPLFGYAWQPDTLAGIDEGPALEDYLVAIAEAGSFGGDLLLPVHERLQKGLLLGKPLARTWWREIRDYLEFYSWDLPSRYRPIANIGVVTAEPMRSLEVLELMTRHNLPFQVIDPERLPAADIASLELLIVLDEPQAHQVRTLAEFARKGGTVVLAGARGSFPWHATPPALKTEDRANYELGEGRVVEVLQKIADPNRFALEMRQILGRDDRVIDVWNGITVLSAPYREPDGKTVLVTAVNYAHVAQQVQLRVPGTFSVVHYESPEDKGVLLPYRHQNGHTEFVLPALRVGGRVFLSHETGLN